MHLCCGMSMRECGQDWAVYVILFMAWFLPTAAALQIYNGVVGHTRLVVAWPAFECCELLIVSFCHGWLFSRLRNA